MRVINHRIEGAPYAATSKKGGKITPTAIVLHFTAGWTTSGDVYTLAKSSRQASAHGVLSRDGEWIQIVPFNVKAWHAGPSVLNGRKNCNDFSIGIEISNIGYLNVVERGDRYTDEYGNKVEQAGDDLERWIRVAGKQRATGKLADWPHYAHPRIGSKVLAWEPYYEPQLKALDELIAALLKTYPTIKHITTHEVIDTRGWKTDVAPHFPFSRYSSLGAEFVLEPHAVKLPRPVVLPKAPINLPVIGPDPQYVASAEPLIHLNENEAAPPVYAATPTVEQVLAAKVAMGDAPHDGPALVVKSGPEGPEIHLTEPVAEKKPWFKFFGKELDFADAWFNNKDSDIV